MAGTVSWGLLILRLVVGSTMAAHGAQKAFGWFGGSGLAKTLANMQRQGFQPSWFWAGLMLIGELGGGLSLALGFLTPLGAAGVVGAMLMAIFKVHWPHGFWNTNHGIEFPLSLLAPAIAIGLIGPGSYSIDGFLGIVLSGAPLFGVLSGVALLVVAVGMFISRRSTVVPTSAVTRAS